MRAQGTSKDHTSRGPTAAGTEVWEVVGVWSVDPWRCTVMGGVVLAQVVQVVVGRDLELRTNLNKSVYRRTQVGMHC